VGVRQVLSEQEVCAEYGLGIPWQRKKRRLGGGPRYLKIGRMVRYRREDIEAYLATHLVDNGTTRPHSNGAEGD